MKNIIVKNMQSNNGNDIPNQFIITIGQDTYFQSYQTIICKTVKPVIANGKFVKPRILLDRDRWNYSKTTGKYRNQFLGEGIAETRAKIKSGEYKLANLN